jgi:hypothetical protein
MYLQQRIEILEAALTDYITKYGLTEKARVAMIWPGPSLTSSDAEPNSHSNNEGDRPPPVALPQG